MAFCLLPQHATAFHAALRSGKLDGAKLASMTSEQRHAQFASLLGEDLAGGVNAAFESKLLLKNQQQGIVNWARQMAGLTPATERDLVARVERMGPAILNPATRQAFLADLAKQKLGVGVTMQEASKIAALAKSVANAKASGNWPAYGENLVKFENYVADLKLAAKPSIGSAFKAGNYAEAAGRTVKEIPGLAKSVKAAWDNSAPFRQGWKTIFSNSVEWQRNTRKTFTDMWDTFGGKAVMDNLKGEAYARENYRNGYYKKADLALWKSEEAFPTSLPERIPVAGKLYKATENAYQGFQYRMRLDLFDKYIDIAKKQGVALDQPQLESIGKLVNSLTSRGHLGKLEPIADVVNVLAFSGRKFKSDLDFLTGHTLQKGATAFVKKQALLNVAKTVAGTAGVLLLADAIAPGSVEWDARSSDFGQIRAGNTRFDVSGGMRQLPILAARLAQQSTKNASTKNITPLGGKGFGAPTSATLLGRFARSKLSPVAGVAVNHLVGEDSKGDAPTFLGDLSDLFEPLPTSAARELSTAPGAAPVAVGLLADMLGISANTFDGAKHKKVERPYFSLPK